MSTVEDSPGQPYYMRLIRAMYEQAKALDDQAAEFAREKTACERARAQVILRARAGGEKSATICEAMADADEECTSHRLAYRLAEQKVNACRHRLAVMHSDLDAWRTKAADSRKSDEFQARMVGA